MFHNILMPVDLNAESSWKKALPVATKLAETYGASLHLLSVVPDIGSALVGSYFPPDFEQRSIEAAEAKLEAFAKDHGSGQVTPQVHIAHGTIYREIEEAAARLSCDLIVMGSHRPELADYLLGPNAERVVRHTNCSVLVVRD